MERYAYDLHVSLPEKNAPLAVAYTHHSTPEEAMARAQESIDFYLRHGFPAVDRSVFVVTPKKVYASVMQTGIAT